MLLRQDFAVVKEHIDVDAAVVKAHKQQGSGHALTQVVSYRSSRCW